MISLEYKVLKIVNTYDWIIATAVSKVKSSNCAIIKIEIITIDKEFPVFPRRVKSKCPAIIFADSRTAKVPGRIMFLIVSINTINGIKTAGVPWGTKWANMWLVLLIHPKNINLNHKGRAKDRVRVKWLVLVKIYGNSPKKLLNKIKVKREMNMKVVPL